MILILGGTTEGRTAVRVADEANKGYYYSTKGNLQPIECAHGIHLTGALDAPAMEAFCRKQSIELLIDAAHPFAQGLRATIQQVAQSLQIPVIRYERRYPPRDNDLIWCTDYQDAIRRMEADGIDRLLALSGVNTLAPLKPFWEKHTCWFRILERESSLNLATQQGFPSEQLVFFQEEKTEEEEKLFAKLHPDAILTKESGFSGYFSQKIEAARRLKIPTYVIQRPPIPETFYKVYGEDGLRKQIERLLPAFFPLKSGFTTGTCATAAAKAALCALLSQQVQTESSILLPSGEQVTLPIFQTLWNAGQATCVVVKESGDDPDVTNQAEIRATVQLWNDKKNMGPGQIVFEAGEGVGIVTLPGLGLEVGEPAINATPRAMIQQALTPLLPPSYSATVTISVPGGKELAKRTFNPKLGIVGGISIIGTSGIVRPFSTEAFIASIRKEVSVAKAIGIETLVINSGAKSERYLRAYYPNLAAQSFIHFGNFIGETLQIANELSFKQVVLGIMIGKAVKLAEGFLDTHCKKVVMNRAFLQSIAQICGSEPDTLKAIGKITLARELWQILPQVEQNLFFPHLLKACAHHCAPLLPNSQLCILLINESGEIRYQWKS